MKTFTSQPPSPQFQNRNCSKDNAPQTPPLATIPPLTGFSARTHQEGAPKADLQLCAEIVQQIWCILGKFLPVMMAKQVAQENILKDTKVFLSQLAAGQGRNVAVLAQLDQRFQQHSFAIRSLLETDRKHIIHTVCQHTQDQHAQLQQDVRKVAATTATISSHNQSLESQADTNHANMSAMVQGLADRVEKACSSSMNSLLSHNQGIATQADISHTDILAVLQGLADRMETADVYSSMKRTESEKEMCAAKATACPSKLLPQDACPPSQETIRPELKEPTPPALQTRAGQNKGQTRRSKAASIRARELPGSSMVTRAAARRAVEATRGRP